MSIQNVKDRRNTALLMQLANLILPARAEVKLVAKQFCFVLFGFVGVGKLADSFQINFAILLQFKNIY